MKGIECDRPRFRFPGRRSLLGEFEAVVGRIAHQMR